MAVSARDREEILKQRCPQCGFHGNLSLQENGTCLCTCGFSWQAVQPFSPSAEGGPQIIPPYKLDEVPLALDPATVITDEEEEDLTIMEGASRDMNAEQFFADFMRSLGLDLSDDHLRDTPGRVTRMYREEFLSGSQFEFTTFPSLSNGLIVQRDIPFVSLCAHHLVPFVGKAHIGYIPLKRMVGLSKLARCLDFYARRPQVQERLVEQVAQAIDDAISPVGVGVVIDAEHLCLTIRGAQKPGTRTIVSAVRGALKDSGPARHEFMTAIGMGS